MIFDDLVMFIADKLEQRYKDPVLRQQVAWWILEAVTGERKEQLFTQKTFGLTEDQENQLSEWLDQLVDKQTPLQYLIGFVPFLDIEILVSPPTLIPRPETEEWVAIAIEELQELETPNLKILDLCTGSGCIALALADAFPQADIWATDISPQAIELATENAEHNEITNVTFAHSDLFEQIPDRVKFDLIVSNPPYIDNQEWNTLDPSVTKWEDKAALVADEKGYGIIKKIIDQAPSLLQYNEAIDKAGIANLWIEIGHEQGPETKKLLQQRGFSNVRLIKDLERKDRVAQGFYQVKK